MKSHLKRSILGFRFLVLALACLFPASVLGQNQPGETTIAPGEAVLRGIEANFGLKAQRLDIPQRKEDLVENEARFDPSLEASVNASDRKLPTGLVFYENGHDESESLGASAGVSKTFRTGLQGSVSLETGRTEDNFIPDAIDPEYRTVATLNFVQPILRDFGVDINSTGINVAKNRIEMAFMAYAHAAGDLGERIESLYYDVCRIEAVLKFRIESMKLADELRDANQSRFENGMIPITPVTEAKTAVTDRRERTILAEQELETASNLLKNLLEIGPDEPLFDKTIATVPMPPSSQSYPSKETALATAMERRSDLKEMEIAMKNGELMIAWYENQKLPRLDIVATAGSSGLSGGDDPVDLFGVVQRSPHTGNYSRSFSRTIEGDGHEWAAGLRFVYPFGNRAAQSRYVKSKYDKRRLEYLYERLKGQVRTEALNGHVAVVKSHDRVKEAEKFVDLARETLEQENQLLIEGLSTTFKILDHQEKLVSARIRHVSALADFHKSLAKLYRATGENLERHGIELEAGIKLIEAKPD